MTSLLYTGPEALLDELTLSQALLRAQSLSGQESGAAGVFAAAIAALGFAVTQDAAGNVIGVLRGKKTAPQSPQTPAVILCGHLDTVALGNPEDWPHPPLDGVIAEGRLWGRGACDMKAALAAMVFAALDAAPNAAGDIVIAAVVQEEVGGLGARYFAENWDARTRCAKAVILGEPSKLQLKLGHRGVSMVQATVPGKMAHAARAALGQNAILHAARFLEALSELDLPEDALLGGSSLTPTQIRSFPEGSANVVPGAATITLDYRFVPADTPNALLEKLHALDNSVTCTIPEEMMVSETGRVRYPGQRIVESYLLSPQNPMVALAKRVLEPLLAANGRPLAEGVWWFATDAPQLAKIGAPVLGFGPGEEELAHTTQESIALEEVRLARQAYCALIQAILEASDVAAEV